jgi:hypothetical protein
MNLSTSPQFSKSDLFNFIFDNQDFSSIIVILLSKTDVLNLTHIAPKLLGIKDKIDTYIPINSTNLTCRGCGIIFNGFRIPGCLCFSCGKDKKYRCEDCGICLYLYETEYNTKLIHITTI